MYVGTFFDPFPILGANLSVRGSFLRMFGDFAIFEAILHDFDSFLALIFANAVALVEARF